MSSNEVVSSTKTGRHALVLAGGGITGLMYEVGALRAINALLVDRTVNDFDVYVGTSAGALAGALLANGFTADELVQMIDQRHPLLHDVRLRDFLQLNRMDTLRRLRTLPQALYGVGRTLVRNRHDLDVVDLLWELAGVLPSGFYSTDPLEQAVRTLFARAGRPNAFAELTKTLYLVATDLDTGERAVFGPETPIAPPISRAVAASSAVPVLYQPVTIGAHDYVDGGLHGAASLDLAIEAGANLVVCINPLAPLAADGTAAARPIRTQGFHTVINQTVRTLFHAGVRYHVKHLRAKYPTVDILLIEPQRADETLFRAHPMHYRSRSAVAEQGFQSVIMGLHANLVHVREVLARHGIPFALDYLTPEALAPVLDEAIGQTERPLLTVLTELEANLHRLKTVL
jgi:predicted acylesterase/phospholipase RssA